MVKVGVDGTGSGQQFGAVRTHSLMQMDEQKKGRKEG